MPLRWTLRRIEPGPTALAEAALLQRRTRQQRLVALAWPCAQLLQARALLRLRARPRARRFAR